MSNRYLNNKDEIPPGGYRYRQQETNFLITAPSWKDLLQRVKAHRQANVIPVGAAFEQEIQNWVCSQIPSSWCSDADPNRTPEVPREAWPVWAKMIALKAQPGDVGVGSTVERVVGAFGGEAFKQFFHNSIGRSCGCNERKEAWDLQYPYK